MTHPTPGTQEWLDQVVEDIIEPELPILDPHHHMWPQGQGLPYTRDDLHRDADAGHNIVKTIFMECGSAYNRDAPEHLRSLGETAYIADQAFSDPKPLIAGIISSIDLRRDDRDELIDAHLAASRGLFRGVRDALARASHPEAMMIPGTCPENLYLDSSFRRGVARLGERGFTYDSWHYHHQNSEFLELARATPGTTMVLDHFGTPVGVGPYASQREEIFAQWKKDIAEIAKCPNVVAKIGGLAMPDNGFGWHTADRPATSDEFIAQQSRYYLHAIECFSPARCMLESNFPVDRLSLSYGILWNAYKKMTVHFSASERADLFYGTAARTYNV
ncbi:MAG: amidohydrolase family protein [Ilumatobacteraceae bacterium]|nr:amidohydrolase family protein [Ilumatobacteraceae bacterium]